jgi:glutaminyl-tRNA synthetase
MSESNDTAAPSNFIRHIIDDDLETGKHTTVATRFPPEPNGYLHIGHAKSICLNFGLAIDYNGTCNLRFDDTNPEKEEVEYVEAIQNDIRWLGFDWEDRLYFASDYFEQLYQYAEELIGKGKAFVCDQTADQIRETRGTLTEPGTNSPFRDRSPEESLDLFRRMRAGEFEDGSRTLRAKIDMTSPNINLRDPVLYRVRRVHHHRTGDAWCIYPMYDYTHGLSDALEHITHSICTLEFEDHRPLYDWFLEQVDAPSQPRQIEFARLNLNYIVLSKRKLRVLVREGHVDGWDDPRMATLAGFRRRGYTPESIRDFCNRVGVAKANGIVDYAMLDACLREDLNKSAPRRMAVLDPVKLVIENYPEGQVEELDAQNNPEDESAGSRKLSFSRELWVEREDFQDPPPRKWRRLTPGKEVRLKHAYYVTCTGVVRDDEGEVTEIRCTYDPKTRGGWSDDGRKVRGTLHWVSAAHAVNAEVRLYDRLFSVEDPNKAEEGKSWLDNLNPDSLEVLTRCQLESSLTALEPGDRVQFMRKGYFNLDPVDGVDGKLVFNRIVGLRDKWARMQKNKTARALSG